MPIRTLLLLALSGFCIIGCTKKNNSDSGTSYNTVYLENKLSFGMAGYDTSELVSVVLKKFQPDGTFSNFVDSVVFTATPTANVSNWIYYNMLNDSLMNSNYIIVSCTDSSYKPYDYEIEIPSNQRTYKISGISFSGDETASMESCCPVMLNTRNVNYTLDGQNYINQTPVSFQGVYVWLQK